MFQRIARREVVHAQIALLVAVGLQGVVWEVNNELLVGPQLIIIPVELFLIVLTALVARVSTNKGRGIHHVVALCLLALLSVANVSSLALVLHSLIISHTDFSSPELLGSAIAIFMTNIIVFSQWYWEIDSPGLSRKRWSKNDQDFQFTQQDLKSDFPNWRAAYIDYLYLSVTNAINFASADARPLTHGAKLLMGSQALISVLTLALVVARSVSILG